MNAVETMYKARIDSIKTIIHQIERKIDDDFTVDPDWNEVGDLNYVLEQLEVIADFWRLPDPLNAPTLRDGASIYVNYFDGCIVIARRDRNRQSTYRNPSDVTRNMIDRLMNERTWKQYRLEGILEDYVKSW